MLQRSFFAGFLFLCLVNSASAINLIDGRFNWASPNSDTQVSLQGQTLKITARASAGGIYNRSPLDLATADFPLAVIEMKCSRDGLGELSWAERTTGFSFRNSLPFYLGPPGQFHKYYLNLGCYNRDKIPLNYLLFFPQAGSGEVELRSFQLVKGNLTELALAGWQEFWGPLGREPDAFTWLVIRSPRLFGRTINYYLNLCLAIFLLYAWRSGKRREFWLALLAAWLCLESSSLLNNWLAFQHDKIYFGKTLEQKRALINARGDYPFLMFADQALPAGAGFDILTPTIRGGSVASYYLYPRTRQPGPPYLLLFKRPFSGELAKKYYVWKTFQPGSYILKVKKGGPDDH